MNRNVKSQERALKQFRMDTEDAEGKVSSFVLRVVGYVCDALGIKRRSEPVKRWPRGIVNARALGLSKHRPCKRKKKAKKAVRPWLAKRAAERREIAGKVEERLRDVGMPFSSADVKRITENVLRNRLNRRRKIEFRLVHHDFTIDPILTRQRHALERGFEGEKPVPMEIAR